MKQWSNMKQGSWPVISKTTDPRSVRQSIICLNKLAYDLISETLEIAISTNFTFSFKNLSAPLIPPLAQITIKHES